MRGCGQLTSARASFVAFVIGSLWAPGAAFSATKHTAPSAKEPFAYNTSGAVNIGADPASVDGPAVLQFRGVTGAIFNPQGINTALATGSPVAPINIGQFVAVPSSLALGQTTTYSGTPFEIEIQTPEFNKVNSVPVLDKVFPTLGRKLDLKTVIENSVLLKGHLDGTVGVNGQVNVTATIDSVKLGSMEVQTQDHVTHYAFPIRFSQLKLPSSWVISSTASVTTAPMIPVTTTTPVTTTSTTTTTVATTPAATTPVSTVPTASPGAIAPAPAAEMLITPTPTPEPSTIVFFAVALGGLLLGRRHLSAR